MFERLPVLHQRMEPHDLLSLGGCSRKGQHSAGAADSLVGFHLMVGNGVGSCDGGRLGALSDDAAVSSHHVNCVVGKASVVPCEPLLPRRPSSALEVD